MAVKIFYHYYGFKNARNARNASNRLCWWKLITCCRRMRFLNYIDTTYIKSTVCQPESWCTLIHHEHLRMHRYVRMCEIPTHREPFMLIKTLSPGDLKFIRVVNSRDVLHIEFTTTLNPPKVLVKGKSNWKTEISTSQNHLFNKVRHCGPDPLPTRKTTAQSLPPQLPPKRRPGAWSRKRGFWKIPFHHPAW